MGMKNVLCDELKKICLTEGEISELEKIAKDFISVLKKKKVTAYIGGSFAKGTVIRKKGMQDVDIFVVFDYSEDILKLGKVLKKMEPPIGVPLSVGLSGSTSDGARLPGKLKKVHGSRDYFQIVCPAVVLELIPVVKNDNPERAENVTDVSLSHVKYVKGAISKNKKIADEIKLAKAFCQAQRCYGAESYIRGLSGYSLEVLIIHFGSFVKFLKGIGKKRVIDPMKYFKGEREVLMELNTSKLQGPIVLIDPTHKYRNVSAGLGVETFDNFLKVKDKFLKKPSLDFFEKKEVDVKALKALCTSGCRGVGVSGCRRRFVELDLFTDRQEGDIAGTKMKKFLDFFASELERKQQKILKKVFDYSGVGQKAKGYLVVEEKLEIEIKGPHAKMNEAAAAFRKAKGKAAYVKKNYLWFKKKVSVEGVFKLVKKVEKEMGAGASFK